MKKYMASEVRHIAQTVIVKKHKQTIDTMLDEVMYLIEEAAKSGEFQALYDISDKPIDVQKAFCSIMEQHGYDAGNKGVRW